MLLTVDQNEETHNDLGSVGVHYPTNDGPTWSLHRQKMAALNRQRDPFDTQAWLEHVNVSNLADVDKQTASHIAASTGWYGTTHTTRTELADLAGVSRVATITARLDRLRSGRYISTKQRYNASSLTALTFPMDPNPPAFQEPGLISATKLHDSEVAF